MLANTNEEEELIEPWVDPDRLNELLDFGFDEIRARRCLLSGDTSELEESVEWLLEHEDDSDIDDPIPLVRKKQPKPDTQPTLEHPTSVQKKLTGFFVGQKVCRGADWKWDDQDGGAGNFGYVTATEKTHARSQTPGWVLVKWEKNNLENSYRAGDQSLYNDLEVVENGKYGRACDAANQAEAEQVEFLQDGANITNETDAKKGLASAVTIAISTRALLEKMGAAAGGIAFLKEGGHRLDAPTKFGKLSTDSSVLQDAIISAKNGGLVDASIVKKADDLFVELCSLILRSHMETASKLVQKYEALKLKYLNDVESMPLHDQNDTQTCEQRLYDELDGSESNAPPLVIVVEVNSEETKYPVSGIYDLDVLKFKNGGINGHPSWNRRVENDSNSSNNDHHEDIPTRYGLASESAKSKHDLGSFLFGHKSRLDEVSNLRKRVLFSTKTFNWTIASQSAVSGSSDGSEWWCTNTHMNAFPHAANWGRRENKEWVEDKCINVKAYGERESMLFKTKAFSVAILDDLKAVFGEIKAVLDQLAEASSSASSASSGDSTPEQGLTSLLELSLCIEVSVAKSSDEIVAALEVAKTTNASYSSLPLSPLVLEKAQKEMQRLSFESELKDVKLGIQEFESLLVYAQQLNEEHTSVSKLLGNEEEELFGHLNSSSGASLLEMISLSAGNESVCDVGCFKCISTHGVAFRKYPRLDDRVDDIRGPDQNDIIFGYVIRTQSSTSSYKKKSLLNKNSSLSKSKSLEEWILVEVHNFGTLFLPMQKGAMSLFRKVDPLPSSTLSLAPFHTFKYVSVSTLKKSYKKNPCAFVFDGSNRRDLCGLLVGKEEKERIFSVLVIKSSANNEHGKINDHSQRSILNESLRDELRSEMTRALGEVFQQWPRAGWSNGSAEFVAAFNTSFNSKDQVFVIAKNICEEDADILEEHLNGAVSRLSYHAIKSCGVLVNENGIASEACPGTTSFDSQLIDAIDKGHLSGGRSTRLLPVVKLFIKRISRSPLLLKAIISKSEDGENGLIKQFYTSMLTALIESFPPVGHKHTQLVYPSSHVESPLLQLVSAFKFATSVQWSAECTLLAMLLRKVAHVIMLSLSEGVQADMLESHPSSLSPMEREDALTCFLSCTSKISSLSFSDIREIDVRRIFEIYDNIGGKGLTSGLVGGETGFGLLLIEGVLSAAFGRVIEPALLCESKEEFCATESKHDDTYPKHSCIPQYLIELISRYGVAKYCQKMATQSILGNFELGRTAARLADCLKNIESTDFSTKGKGAPIEIFLEKLNHYSGPKDKLQCSIQGIDRQISEAMDLGYQFATLQAQSSGVTAHEFTSLDICGSLLRFLNESSTAISSAFVSALVAFPLNIHDRSYASADSKTSFALRKLIMRIQSIIATNERLSVFNHRHLDIVDTTSKVIALHIFFPDRYVNSASQFMDVSDKMVQKHSKEHCVLEATRTSMVQTLVAHVLSMCPVSSFPIDYLEACRTLVGMRIKEKHRNILSSSVSSENSWRFAIVLEFDEHCGAHCLKYESSNRDGVSEQVESENMEKGIWVRLQCRDVVLVSRVSEPQAAPNKRNSISDDFDDDELDEEEGANSTESGLKSIETIVELRKVVISGDCVTQNQFMGVYYEVSGEVVHGAPIFRSRPMRKPSTGKVIEYFLFKSSASGMWVVTDTAENFAENLGFLRCSPDVDSKMPCMPVQAHCGGSIGWQDETEICLSVELEQSLPICGWIGLSEAGKPQLNNSKAFVDEPAKLKHFVTSQPLQKAKFDVYGHNCIDEKSREILNKCRWFQVEVTKVSESNEPCNGGFKIGIVNSKPRDLVMLESCILDSYVIGSENFEAQVPQLFDVGTELMSLSVGDCVRVYVKRDNSIHFSVKKKKGSWKAISLKSSVEFKLSCATELWGCISLGGTVVEVKLHDVSGCRVIGEEGRYNIDRSIFHSRNLGEKTGQVERWLRGSIQLRSRPEFPGDEYRTMHTVSAGDTFKFTEIRELVQMISLVKSDSEGEKEEKAPLKVLITYYKLADGRGWVHDFDRDNISPRKPSIRAISRSLVGQTICYNISGNQDIVTVLSEDVEEDTVNLVTSKGICLIGVPQSELEENSVQSRRRSPKSPSPTALQRSFSAVTTEQNPVSNGGFEFVRRETYTDIDEIMSHGEDTRINVVDSVGLNDQPVTENYFPTLSLEFSSIASKDQNSPCVISYQALPKKATLFQAIYALQGGVHIEDYFDLICSVVSVDNNRNRSPCFLRGVSDDGLHVVLEEDRQALLKSGGPVFSDAVEVIISIHKVLSDSILIGPVLSCAPNSSTSSESFLSIREAVGTNKFDKHVLDATSNILSVETLWVNSVLESKLSSQLKPVAMVTGAVPKWIRRLPRMAPFLFTKKLRERMMKFMAFGVSRGIVSLQEERYPVAALEQEVASCFQLMTADSLEKAQRLEQAIQRTMEKHATSQLAKNNLKNVSVSPGWLLLQESMSTFSDARFLKSGSLEVTFRNESGFGTGVTAGFYSRIAQVLQTRAVGLGLSVLGIAPTSQEDGFCQAEVSWGSGSRKKMERLLSTHDISIGGTSADFEGNLHHRIWKVGSIDTGSIDLSFSPQRKLSIGLKDEIWMVKNGQKVLVSIPAEAAEFDEEYVSLSIEYPINAVLLPKQLEGSFMLKNALPMSVNTFELVYTELFRDRVSSNEMPSNILPSYGFDFLLDVLSVENGGLQLWIGGENERSQRTCKVKVLSVFDEIRSSDKCSLQMTVQGYLPNEWLSSNVSIRGAPFYAMNWVPDEVNDSVHGSFKTKYGLFPAPLLSGMDSKPVLKHFNFLGRLVGKALVDGYLVPIRIHPAFFSLLRGNHLDASLYLPSESSHFNGDMRASHIAKLFVIFPQVKAIQQLDESDQKVAMSELLSISYSFTGGLVLKEWLEMLSFSEPITKTLLHNNQWDSEVNGSNLYQYLTQLEDLWLGSGILQQVQAFRSGFADMADDNSGSLAFEAGELRLMLCGPDTIEWSIETLKHTLRPKGDFTVPVSDIEGSLEEDCRSSLGVVDTMDWLREALVDLSQTERLKFMELTTGLRSLSADKVITVRKTSERWPFFHSCTNQFDFPLYRNRDELKMALREALANGSAGGFSELSRSFSDSDGRS